MSNNRYVTVVAIAAVVIAGLVITSPAEAQRRAGGQIGANCVGGLQALLDEIEVVPLTPAEESAAIYLREEEKLARDVYLTLAERWQLPIFGNIARAEQRHMDLVLLILQLYGIADPVSDDSIGAFNDPELVQLYVDLIADGDVDLVGALTVGATIEDMDLADLYQLLTMTDNDHLELVAYNLAKGSRNHLRSFLRALTAQDATYEPHYLDQETFDAILAADMEQRMYYGADGEPVPACGAAVGGFGMRRGPGHQNGQGDGNNGGANGSGTGECDGTGSNNGSGECDGTGPHGGGNGGGN